MSRISSRTVIVLAGTVLLVSAGAAVRAQYAPGYPGYYPGFYPGRAGGYLYGSAQVMDSYGNLMVTEEQARIAREQANQAKLDTQRKAFDQRQYERANTPTFGQEQVKLKQNLLYRILTNATQAEIVSGKAQNVIAPFLRDLSNRGIQGPPVELDPSMVQQINVKSAGSESGVGMLRPGDHLEWPLVLRGPIQQKISELIPAVTEAAIKGTLDFKQYRELSDAVAQLKSEHKKQFYAEQIDGTAYLTGNRFLDKLEGSVNDLQKPGAGKFLSGSYAAKGRTVEELVRNMGNQGLQFAPASPGNEPAYRALYNAMVSYSTGAETASGFRVQGARVAPGGYSGGPK
jgi:hypothetical protein